MSLPLILIGGGGHASVLADAMQLSGNEILGFVAPDSTSSRLLAALGISYLGDDSFVLKHTQDSVFLVNGIGSSRNMQARKEVYEKFNSLGYRFKTVIHPSAVISKQSRVLEGAQIMAGVIVQTGVLVGVDSILNSGAIVDHDCQIGSHCHIAPRVVLSGSVMVEDETHIGTGAVVIQGIHIGREGLVAAGSVVVRDVGENTTVMGVPARVR